MTTRNFQALFEPRTIALIGASDKSGAVGAVVARNLVTAGFRGSIFMVNRRDQVVQGRSTFPSVDALPETPDLAVIVTPAASVPGLVADLGRRGCRAVIVISAGLSPDQGRAMLDAARPHTMRILGPNCLGFQSPPHGINATFAHLQPESGRIALVSQSGAVLTSLIDWAADRGIGFSHVVSLGDMHDIDFGDMLDYLALDERTQSILLYVENVTDARKFMSAGRIASRAKPVIVVKAGRSQAGARAAATHTGALAGADLVYDAAFRRAGMLRVDELGDLFDAAEMLAAPARIGGDRLAILTNGGGAGVLAVDALQAAGGRLAELTDEVRTKLDAILPVQWSRANPIDIIGDADAERYRAALEIILAGRNQDAVLVMNCPTGVADSRASAEAVLSVAAAKPEATILTCWLGAATAKASRQLFAARTLATFDTPDQAIRAFMQKVNYRRNQDLLLETPDRILTVPGSQRDAAREIVAEAFADRRTVLSEPEAKAVLAAYGVPTVQTLTASTPSEAGARAEELKGRVALKILSPDITHKTDVGGVRLGLSGREAVEAAAADMLAVVRQRAPTARLKGFTVQPMIERANAIELIVGANTDPTFGPVVLFGAGGISAEVVADRAIALPPLNSVLARDLIGRTRVARLLHGFRDVAPANMDAIETALINLAALTADIPQIVSLDVNPLLADAEGVIALDARIQVGERPAGARTAIHPYPAALARHADVEGREYLLRPIRPDDEAALVDMAARSSPEDLRLRFFGPMRELSHKIAARLCQLDYDREMAFVAIEPNHDNQAVVGVAHLIIDPNFERADFAVMVRTDYKKHGLGYALMQGLFQYAQSRGVGVVSGDVLASNEAMLHLARALGATLERHPEDVAIMKATFRLPAVARPAGSSPLAAAGAA